MDEQATTKAAYDVAKLAALLPTLKQGDLITGSQLISLSSPEFPLYPDEEHAPPLDESLVAFHAESPTGLYAIISTDCDIERPPAIEPHLIVCPVSQVSKGEWENASTGRSPRLFALPSPKGDPYAVVDTRLVFSVEKPAILSSQVKVIPCPLNEVARTRLRVWLGRRFGRPAFPDEIVKAVIEPIEKALAAVAGDPNFKRVLANVTFYGLRYTPGVAQTTLLLLVDDAGLDKSGVDDQLLTTFHKKLYGQLKANVKDGYSISPYVKGLDDISARELLSHQPFDPDLS